MPLGLPSKSPAVAPGARIQRRGVLPPYRVLTDFIQNVTMKLEITPPLPRPAARVALFSSLRMGPASEVPPGSVSSWEGTLLVVISNAIALRLRLVIPVP